MKTSFTFAQRIVLVSILFLWLPVNSFGQCFSPYKIGDAPPHMLVDAVAYNDKFVLLDLEGYVILYADNDLSINRIDDSLINSIFWNNSEFLVLSGDKVLKSYDLSRWDEVPVLFENKQNQTWLSKSYFSENEVALLESSTDPLNYEMKEWGIPYKERSFRSSYQDDKKDDATIFYGPDVTHLKESSSVPWSRDILKIKDKYLLLTRSKGIYASKDIANWQYYSGEKQPKGFPRSMVYNGSILVIVGDFGYITTSNDDGKAWQVQKLNTQADLYDVIWDGKQFIAVGNCGTVATSTDGHHWLFSSTNQPDFYTAIAYNGETYVIVGAGPGKERNKKTNAFLMQRMFTSSDAETWIDSTNKLLELYRQ